ncbi:MAG: isoprenylcysteine carboxylmethyltransferase family protein [Anaerolineales bacterium]|nr:isoprenylcysteine carboxylmethyltransferase family protein [Anaerolineales bacterium]MCB9111222.1 isoprenylcysteine carboxylmethyltransferase family protein [Anaerolineales bacterium]
MQQKTDHAQVKVNPFLIYISFALLSLALQRLVPLPFLGEAPAQVIGAILVISNLIAGLPALIGMIAARTSPNPNRPTTALVLSGTFRLSRNPMYLGLSLVYCGVATILQLPWGLIFLPLIVWLLTIWVIIPEEKYLEEKFGAEYSNYKLKVRRWI